MCRCQITDKPLLKRQAGCGKQSGGNVSNEWTGDLMSSKVDIFLDGVSRVLTRLVQGYLYPEQQSLPT